ncbi:hypothetical protein J2T57_001234 [Natronocella acetinitrilica]|uniref:Uncharacterized protein n=1 Tax=Natronocella acetinitrilica TaxID=414046 RepID=A0AAE3G2C7_9GAMM|nr:hypothetical protein [Natronocella acetinitrilica]MCP1674132.1 hypothetical protein [Natronocella acetinitrilica]
MPMRFPLVAVLATLLCTASPLVAKASEEGGAAADACFRIAIDDGVDPTLSFSGQGCLEGDRVAVVSSLAERHLRGRDLAPHGAGNARFVHEYFSEGHRVEVAALPEEGADAFLVRWRVMSRAATPRVRQIESGRMTQWSHRPVQREEVYRHLLRLERGSAITLAVGDASSGGERRIRIERR